MKHLISLFALAIIHLFLCSTEMWALDSLALDGLVHEISYSGTYVDFTIPKDIKQYDHIEFYLKGGDGGRRRVPNLCRTKGGDGAAVTVRFSIGTGNHELRPGGKIRFIVGEKGESNGSNGITGAGGGGGTAVLYLDPSLSGNPGCSRIISSQTFNNLPSDNLSTKHGSCWIILAVAGGGGGAYSSGVCGGSAGKGGNAGKNGTDGKGLDPGKGGIGGAPGICGGGGLLSNSSCTSSDDGGEGGYFTGGAGGNLGYQRGGFGYGGGGPSDASGGGGGGYSGGGNGTLTTGGGGGGSFANSDATYSSIVGGGTDGTPDNGFITYVFKDLNSNVPDARCRDITVELDASGSFALLADSSDNGSINPISGGLTFFYFALFSPPIYTVNLDCNDVGDHAFTMVAANNVTAGFCTSVITVEDNIPPSANCRNRNVNLNANGEASITAAQIDNGSNDACGIRGLTVSPSTFDCSHLGPNTVTLSVEDRNENFSTCTANVNVRDQIAPSITCKDITVTLTGGSVQVPLSASLASYTENCHLPTLNNNRTYTCADVGLPVISVLAISDQSNNTSNFCGASVTVVETTPPTAHCQSTTVYLDASGIGTVDPQDIDNQSTDNCGIASFSSSPSTVDCTAMGTPQLVTLTVTDGSGNTATCTAHVSAVDTVSPVIVCPSNQTVNTDPGTCSGTYSIPNPVMDNCADGPWGATFSGNANGLPTALSGVAAGSASGALSFEEGVTTVTLSGEDLAGNVGQNCQFTVTVIDNEPPTVICPNNISIPANSYCGASYVFINSAADNCAVYSLGIDHTSSTGGSGASYVFDGSDLVGNFELGINWVELTARDYAGNLSSNCTFTVTVLDSTPPALDCPAAITVDNAPNTCEAMVSYAVSSSDNCGSANHVQTDGSGLTSGDVFPVGTTTQVYEATDAAGNTSTCSFSITVNDTTPPVINCPNSQTFPVGIKGCYRRFSYTITRNDNCTFLENLSAQGVFPPGVTTRTFTARDAAGNTSSCSFTITVEDNLAPTISCPADITVGNDPDECGAVVSYSVTSNDNCSASHAETGGSGLASGDEFPVGVTSQTYVATDAAGNTASCSFTITVNDTTPPEITCPSDRTVSANWIGCQTGFINYLVERDDNCKVFNNRLRFAQFPLGVNTRVFTATDDAGNTATCTWTVTVEDTEAPQFSCPNGNVVRYTDPGQCDHTAVGGDLNVTAFDLCQLQSKVNDINNTSTLAGEVFPKGKTLVTWTATDAAGNSSTCSYHIKIVDNEAPIFDNCPDDTTLTVPFNSGGSYLTWPALTATDNCNPLSKLTITGFPLSGSFFSIGTTPVNWTATDKKGNVGNCDFEVTVVEQGAPAPNGWTQGGVGSSSSCATNWNASTGTLAVIAAGGNVSMSADNFCGVTIPHSGSIIDFRARVMPAGGSYYDQAGIMMRESLANNAKHATMLLTGTSVPMMSLRASAGGFPLSTSGTAVTKPYWLRLYRAGSTITGYISADGMNWSQIMAYPNLLSSSLYLVLFSTTSGAQGQATFDNITINGAAARFADTSIGTELTLKAHPNPFSEDLFIAVKNALPGETYQVRLSNMLGQRVYGYETGASAEGRIEQRISLEYLPAGTYLLEVSAGVQREVLKVVKQ